MSTGKELYRDATWRIVEESATLPDGRVKRASRVYHCDTVSIIALPTPNTILLLREFRPFYGTYIWMLPSGKMDKENDPQVAAQRELQEETGMKAADLSYYCSTRQSERMTIVNHVFIARSLSPSPLPQDDCELIEVHELPIDQAIENILHSAQVHTVSAYGLLRFAREHS